MNRRIVLFTVGRIALIETALLILPMMVCLIYGEYSILFCFAVTAGISLAFGLVLRLIARPRNHLIFAREGFFIVASAWIFVSAVGALPFVFSGSIPNYCDAFFETVSGFTTTGASILPHVEEAIQSQGLLFWRSFTHWIGGMGVLVFLLAVLPSGNERSIHILRAEVPGPMVGKLVPRLKDTAKILYLIYFAITLLETVLLIAGGMSLFDSLVHTFGTAGTGGFGIKADSVASYSPYCQWVITVFMLIFGINFNLFYLLLLKRLRPVLHSAELWAYLGIAAVATMVITWDISKYADCLWPESLRHAAFQVSSIMTTTGFSTTDFNAWPSLSKSILFLLMLVGGCAGSTAGGLKVSRVVLLFRMARRELSRLLHPRSVRVIVFEEKRADEPMLNSVALYFVVYMMFIGGVFLLLSFEPFNLETNLSATVACFNNVGPGFAGVGPTASYAAYSDLSKLVLSLAMLAGRLEIFPILLFFSPSSWKAQ